MSNTNENKTSIHIGGKAERTGGQTGDINTRSSEQPTLNDTSISVEVDAIDSRFKTGSISVSQNLAEATAEIQELLKQLAKTNPTTSEVLEVVEARIKNKPTLKARFRNALKEGCSEAVKAAFNYPAIHIPFETVKGFIEAE